MNSCGSWVSSSCFVTWSSCSAVGVVSSSSITVTFPSGWVGMVCWGCGVLRFCSVSVSVVV